MRRIDALRERVDEVAGQRDQRGKAAGPGQSGHNQHTFENSPQAHQAMLSHRPRADSTPST